MPVAQMQTATHMIVACWVDIRASYSSTVARDKAGVDTRANTALRYPSLESQGELEGRAPAGEKPKSACSARSEGSLLA